MIPHIQAALALLTDDLIAIAQTPVPAMLMIGVRLVIVVGGCYVLVNLIRSWRMETEPAPRWLRFARPLIAVGIFLIGVGFVLSALITGGTSQNTPVYQVFIQAGIFLRLLVDAYSSGQRIQAARRGLQGGPTI